MIFQSTINSFPCIPPDNIHMHGPKLEDISFMVVWFVPLHIQSIILSQTARLDTQLKAKISVVVLHGHYRLPFLHSLCGWTGHTTVNMFIHLCLSFNTSMPHPVESDSRMAIVHA